MTTPQPDSPAPAPKIDDGGPAFPEHFYFDPGKGMYGQYVSASCVGFGGMTLRDYFAAAALQGIIAGMGSAFPTTEDFGGDRAAENCYQVTAVDAYAMADQMLAARKGGVA